MHSFTSKRSGRRTAKTGLPAWGPVNAPGQGLVDAGPHAGRPLRFGLGFTVGTYAAE